MPQSEPVTDNLSSIDDSVRALVRSAAAIAGGDETKLRAVLEEATDKVERTEMDEVILQSYLFAGFPRALNAARLWRSVSGQPAPAEDREAELMSSSTWVERGEET